jgi:F0F1-type ATP synthase epsilon subunit
MITEIQKHYDKVTAVGDFGLFFVHQPLMTQLERVPKKVL